MKDFQKSYWLFRSVSPFMIFFLVTSSISLFYCSMQRKLAFGFSSGIILMLRYFFNQKTIKIVHLQKTGFWEAEVCIFWRQTHGAQSFNSVFFQYATGVQDRLLPSPPHPSSAHSNPDPYFPATGCQVTPLRADPLISPAKFLVLPLLMNF